MKLIIQIPCLNEAETLAVTIADLPREIAGIDEIEYLVIDDGSTDRTVPVAWECGVHHVLSLGSNMGLARAFMAGIEKCLALGADIIVNTDADNQYVGADIRCLVEPILAGQAQIVVGARPIKSIEGFSPLKKLLQGLGSWVVRKASGTDIPDAPSGFRAYHKDAASRLYVLNTYSYTLETIIQAGRKRIPMTSVPIRVNGELRPSRLFKSIPEYISRSAKTIIRVSVIYRPLATFTTIAVWIALPAVLMIGRFVSLYLQGDGSGHVQSLVLSGALLAIAFVVMMAGILSDLISANRDLLQDIRARQLRQAIPQQDAQEDDVSTVLATKLRNIASGGS
ncbi:MAG: glycosyltransferase family 2 protein [Rhizobiales bacterium]|nr:glycosyltransferase family 2 protein [Hyphomicrobiales bacterium]